MLRKGDKRTVPFVIFTEEVISGIETGTAFGRLGRPEEMADFIVKLLEPGHEYLTGVDLILDGGKHAMGTVKQYE